MSSVRSTTEVLVLRRSSERDDREVRRDLGSTDDVSFVGSITLLDLLRGGAKVEVAAVLISVSGELSWSEGDTEDDMEIYIRVHVS